MVAKCAVCQADASFTCKSCCKVNYCSVDHQQEHWKSHKVHCPTFRVEKSVNTDLGLQAVANRNLKAGVVTLDEPVCLQAPQWECSSFDDASTFPCTACGRELDGESFQLCSTCNWPVCGVECQTNPNHNENECHTFAQFCIQFPPPRGVTPSDISMCILMIRGMRIQQQNPGLYEKLKTLQCEPGDVTKLSGRLSIVEEYVGTLKRLVHMTQDDEAVCRRVVQLTDINGFTVRMEVPTESGTQFRTNVFVYLEASRFNHSCSPNCTWSIGPSPSNIIGIRTSVPIKAGQPLTISYLMRRNMFGTAKRQHYFRQFGFTCKCNRCLDPTELGSNLSTMICESCTVGRLLPSDPLDLSTLALWKCTSCSSTKKSCEVLPTIDRVHSIIDKHIYSTSESTSRCGEFCLFVIAKYKERLLHPNHWLLVEATRAIERVYTASLDSMDLTALDRYVDYCYYLLGVQAIIHAGISPGQAHLQRYILNALARKIVGFGKDLSTDEVKNTHAQCRSLHREAQRYFKGELPDEGNDSSFYSKQLDGQLKSIESACAQILTKAESNEM